MTIATSSIPQPIRRGLRQIDLRLRTTAALRGLGRAAIVLALVVVVSMSLDFAWILPRFVRWLVWIGWVGCLGVLLAEGVVSPLLRRVRPLELAALVERQFPALGERLTSAVALLTQGRHAHGSPALIAALVDEAAARAEAIAWDRTLPNRSAARWLWPGLCSCGLVLISAFAWPDPVGILFRRAIAPWSALARPSRFLIEVSGGKRTVALGSDLEISAEVRSRFGQIDRNLPTAATLEWTDSQGGEHRAPMVAGASSDRAGQRFSVTLPRIGGSFAYRVTSGSATSREVQVAAVDPPSVQGLKVMVEPPPYTKLPAAVVRRVARIEAWQHSRISWTIEPNHPVRTASLLWQSQPGQAPASRSIPLQLSADGKTRSASLIAHEPGRWSLALEDEQGFKNPPDPWRSLIVRRDAPPAVAWTETEAPKDARPDDVLLAGVLARDDFAVAAAELHVQIEPAQSRTKPAPRKVPLPGLGSHTARGDVSVALKELGLRPGDTLRYQVRVLDNRPDELGGPQEAWTPGHVLAIVAQAEPILTRRRSAERRDFAQRLEAIKKSAAANRQETEQLRYAADAASRGNGKWDEARSQGLTRRETAARQVVDQLRLLARDLESSRQFASMARSARQAADVEAESGRAMLDQARRAADAALRLADLRQADARLAALQNRIEDLTRRFEALARLDDDRQQLRAIAERQEALAHQAETLTPPREHADRAALDRVQADQEKLKNEVDALAKQSPALRANVLEDEAREAGALAERAHALANRQRDEARRTGRLAQRGEILKALADAQRALEVEARRLALEVDLPLTENGRGRVNTETISRAIEPIAHADLPAARQRLEEAETELRRVGRDLEELPRDPRALARRLTRRQDELIQQADAVVRELKARNPDDKAKLIDRLKPLADRQQQIARLAEAIPPDDASQREAVQDLTRRARRVLDDLHEGELTDLGNHLRATRGALDHLADVLPDPWHRLEPARKRMAEARQRLDEVGRELERHLRETGPRPGKPFDAAAAARDLANRLAPLVQRQDEAAAWLAKMEIPSSAQPQRERAAHRFKMLAEALAHPPEQVAREALPGLQTSARAALERLEHKLNGRAPADDVAAELADDQRLLQKRIARAQTFDRQAEAADQERIAFALRSLNLPDAALAQDEAVRLAEQAARALADEKTDARDSVRLAHQAIGVLVRALDDRLSPRERAALLARAQSALVSPQNSASAAPRAKQQRRIAEELARLPAEIRRAAVEPVERARVLADRAARQDPAVTAAELAGARAQALAAIEAMANEPLAHEPVQPEPHGPSLVPAPDDPELGVKPAQAIEAASLARRERQIRERLQAILGEQIVPQEHLRDEAETLGRELGDLRDRSRDLSPHGQGPANAASHLLSEQAPQVMNEAVGPLAQGRSDAARDLQRRAAGLLESAAQQLDDFAAALLADRPAEAAGTAPGNLSEAQDAQRQAARQLAEAREANAQARAAQAAAKAMHQAANGLRAAAEIPGEDQEEMPLAQSSETASSHGNTPSDADPRGGPAGTTSPDLAALQDLVRRQTGRTWGELPGHLRTEILQMTQGRYRDDYARLIQLYFQEIAASEPRVP